MCSINYEQLLKWNEPPHDKTNKVTVCPAKTQICPGWSESSLCSQWLAKNPSFLHVDSEDSDQPGWMPRLIWVFAGRTVTLLCPQLRRSCGSILVSGGPSVRLSIRSSKTVHARVLKFHIWIPHGKIVDPHFFSCPSYLPFWSYAPLKKCERNLMHAISYEPYMLGFWNFIYGFLMEK